MICVFHRKGYWINDNSDMVKLTTGNQGSLGSNVLCNAPCDNEAH